MTTLKNKFFCNHTSANVLSAKANKLRPLQTAHAPPTQT